MKRWTPLPNSSSYDVLITRNNASDVWTRWLNTEYTVKDVLLYDSITINVRTPGSYVNNIVTYNVSKVKTQIGGTVTISWAAPFFPLFGQYNFYHTYRQQSTIFSIPFDRVYYRRDVLSPKYIYLTRPLNSTNMMFEIRNITLDDAGFYNGGITYNAAMSGGGVVLIVLETNLKSQE